MHREGQLLDKKSLRVLLQKTVDWGELVKDCIAFANAAGGCLVLGVEDDKDAPAADQRIPLALADTLKRKIGERTVNVSAQPTILTAANGGQYIEVLIPRATAVASTSDGRYYLRVADQSKPVTGDEVLRLTAERNSSSWETPTLLLIPRTESDAGKLDRLAISLRSSDRVKKSVKEKGNDELLDHYQLARGAYLTHLGVLCIGRREHRALLPTAPVIQVIKYDELGQKINKQVWDDHALNPMELVEEVWRSVPDFRESYELPSGLYRQQVPAFDEIVVRELLVNALVHRPYTQHGDIFLNLHPDRLDVVNPGLLPLGVTPRNVLHTTVRRDEHLARLFHDLKLMEREGSGFDKMFEVLLSQGRPAPQLQELHDGVQVTVFRRVIKPQIIDFIAKADLTYAMSQREKITLGLLAQHEALTARDLAHALELSSVELLNPWLKRLLDWGVVLVRGRTQATRYFVNEQLIRSLDFEDIPISNRMDQQCLVDLITKDVKQHPQAQIAAIHCRIGAEIPRSRIRRCLGQLVKEGRLRREGAKRGVRYV
ncbi:MULTISPECIES: ATP-binding protein [unclassified Achromobacter]|uniref:ATP-binding protein n=1 Tax=unclassified Achromobacter TaxID=2626865 RepID=UPI000B51AC28|nr:MULTISPECIES: ATP-binding protein [unclassified Achromobacter]OWT80048.1 ATP-dependent DNA helicase [Achromobacter sp. HZ34]OWT81931.1 ATP-dependent DNA helicase [Achromobacter sp. HZ28]